MVRRPDLAVQGDHDGSGDRTLNAEYLSPIAQRYHAEPGPRDAQGAPTGPEVVGGPVHHRSYENGRPYWTDEAGVHVLRGGDLAKLSDLGGHAALGVPTTDERATPDGVGRCNHFSEAASIYWTPDTGSHAVWGGIRVTWADLGWERGPMGYPTTDETRTPDGVGRFNHFSEAASIYWTPGTGAHEVHGRIRERWVALGWERSYLGCPTTGEFAVSGGRQSNFQHGYVRWFAANNTVIDRRY